MSSATVDAFAIAAPGLEAIVAGELARLGIAASAVPGGVTWQGPLDAVARANLWVRTASRVIVRMGSFRARTFGELERHAEALPWERFVRPGAAVGFRVTSRKSRLYHTGAIAQRLMAAVADRAGAAASEHGGERVEPLDGGDEGREDDDSAPDSQLFVVRVARDNCTVSADSSGALLHRRGYRQAVAKAPLRETLAAAMLLATDWPDGGELIDPLCGSGTIAIEAALIARRIAPGLGRSFAFQRWPCFDGAVWDELLRAARSEVLDRSPVAIHASDRDAGAVAAAIANAERAGVAADVAIARLPVSAIEPTADRGWVITNPPYGVRVGEGGSVRDLYAALGNVLRARFRGWRVGVLAPAAPLELQLGLELRERFRTQNGGIPVRMVTGQVRS